MNADGKDGLQIWKVPANITNKPSRTTDKGWSSICGLGEGLNAPHHKNATCYEIEQTASDVGRSFATNLPVLSGPEWGQEALYCRRCNEHTRSSQTREISWLAEELLASQEGLCSMELVSSNSSNNSLHDPHRQRHTTTKIRIHILHFSLKTSDMHYPHLTVHRPVADTVLVNFSNLTQVYSASIE